MSVPLRGKMEECKPYDPTKPPCPTEEELAAEASYQTQRQAGRKEYG